MYGNFRSKVDDNFAMSGSRQSKRLLKVNMRTRAAAMVSYRIYTLDPTEHIRDPPTVIECENDQDAIEKAKQLLNGGVIEIWEQQRLIARLTPDNVQ
jgi:hypothetical protein